jgi:hypothetical protein
VNTPAIERSTWSVRLASEDTREGEAPAFMLDTVQWREPQMSSRFEAAFIPQNTGTAQVIASRTDGNGDSLTYYDLESGQKVRVWADFSDTTSRPDVSILSRDGKFVASRQYRRNETILSMTGIRPGSRSWSSIDIEADPAQPVRLQFSPGDDYYLVAGVQDSQRLDGRMSQVVYSARVLPYGMLREPRRIAVANMPVDEGLPALALPPNEQLMAYVNPAQELHAVLLDGTHDTPVATDVRAVWSLKPREDVTWWR